MKQISYTRHRFPGSIIQHAVWLYFRFPLSYRDIEDLLSERGIDVTFNTLHKAQEIAHAIKNKACLCLIDDVVIVGEGLFVANIVECLENADSTLDDASGDLPNLTCAFKRAYIFADSTVERISFVKGYAAFFQKVCEFLHAIGMEPIQGGSGLVRRNIPVDSGYQLLKCFVALELVDGIHAGDGPATLNSFE